MHFVIQREDPVDRDEIEDIIFEFEALQTAAVDVDVTVTVDSRPLGEIALPERLVYARKEQ